MGIGPALGMKQAAKISDRQDCGSVVKGGAGDCRTHILKTERGVDLDHKGPSSVA
jgi:hypothetical protein